MEIVKTKALLQFILNYFIPSKTGCDFQMGDTSRQNILLLASSRQND